ncbi:MAG TPA: Uma2 family endonuclease [Coleofasciculaceae cyanobacterium]|jgi:Uma2 family endonuclease
MNTYTLNLKPLANRITVEHFEQLCQLNPDLKLETNDRGELLIMPPTGYETGMNNAGLIAQFWNWNRKYKLGVVCDSSTGFILANGAIRSPDVSWIAKERVNRLTREEKTKFLSLAPDFVLELMSPSDRLETIQAKMKEYQDNGVKLGWLINSQQQQVEIYRLGQSTEILNKPLTMSGENILIELVIELDFIWE